MPFSTGALMHDRTVTPTGRDFSGVRAAMQRNVGQQLVHGVSWACCVEPS